MRAVYEVHRKIVPYVNRAPDSRSAAIATYATCFQHTPKHPNTFARWIVWPVAVPRTSAYPCACPCGTARARLRPASRKMINRTEEVLAAGRQPAKAHWRGSWRFGDSVIIGTYHYRLHRMHPLHRGGMHDYLNDLSPCQAVGAR
jgi:hypothetical protein